ncbi:DUF4783 domain-containing protein [Bacteroidota bacterium]
MNKIFKILVLITFFSLSVEAANDIQQDTIRQGDSKAVMEIFRNFEEGINSSNIDVFSNYFSEKTYISLVSGNTGYFSPGQSYYVLRDFLNSYKPLNFKLVSKVSHTLSPFASGVLRYSIRGIRRQAMVFISLKCTGDHWSIVQITIN